MDETHRNSSIADDKRENTFINEFHSSKMVSGYTHDYYRYPARFSPEWVRRAISEYSSPGELIFDPFMGSGTTLVEAMAAGRPSIGTDINELACFIAKVKTTLLTEDELSFIQGWFNKLSLHENLRSDFVPNDKDSRFMPKNMWAIRSQISIYLNALNKIKEARIKNFIRCVILKTAQWAIDGHKDRISIKNFRTKIRVNQTKMTDGMRELRTTCAGSKMKNLPEIINDSASNCIRLKERRITPKLILTSPPYPGVHVLYHRWQFQSRKEFSAPYWISGTKDGHGEAHYATPCLRVVVA
jgi:hypothetical protein